MAGANVSPAMGLPTLDGSFRTSGSLLSAVVGLCLRQWMRAGPTVCM